MLFRYGDRVAITETIKIKGQSIKTNERGQKPTLKTDTITSKNPYKSKTEKGQALSYEADA